VLKKLLLLIIPLAILAGGWFFIQTKETDSSTPSLSQESSPVEDSTLTKSEPPVETEVATAIVDDINSTNQNPAPIAPDQQPDIDVDVTTIAVDQRLTDEEFERLEALISNDRGLRLELLDEFRYNTDPERAKQLAALLGPYNDPEIVQTASELVYSGDPNSKTAGLALLGRVQTRSNEARDIAIDLLSAETDPKFLVSTMNVLAKPARGANESQRQLLTDNLTNLSSHHDSRVRSHSLALMGRWDKNSPASRESLTRGLSDGDAAVRSSAVYAIRNIQNPNENMIGGLLNIAEDSGTKKSTRNAALSALSQMNLSGTPIRRFNLARRDVNRRVANSGN